MAPEEFERGATIDERACQTHPTDRWQRMADFYAAWRQAAASVC